MKSHLIVGEVQSGKTMSFTGVASLARDNGFSLIVVIGGTKNNLLDQTVARLKKDLHIDGDGGANPWELVKGDELVNNPEKINKILDQWNDQHLPDDFRKTVIVATLKTKPSLNKVVKGLNKLHRKDLQNIATLIIDDEADQAGLNIAEEVGDESSVYAALSDLRNTLPNNDYLMYTATPQATLLLRIEDHLSPETVTVLQSGSLYVGGRTLFDEGNTYVMEIPQTDIDQAVKPVKQLGCPKTLKTALSFFLVGLAVAQKRGNPQPCSMLIHPGTTTSLHNVHKQWTIDVLAAWSSMLRDMSEPIFKECYETDFAEAFDWINQSVDLEKIWPAENMSARNHEILNYVSHWISQIEVRVVNSEKAAQDISTVEWKSHPGWIVIGGAKLERGYTIENLTVTYMPRSPGVGNADSIQQRGRFFGYKRNYIDLLKGWMGKDLSNAFLEYVAHEDSMRSELKKLDVENQPVSTWRRKILLSDTLKPTRSQVIKLAIKHEKFRKGFVFRQHHLFTNELQQNHEEYEVRLRELMKDAVKHHLDNRNSKSVDFEGSAHLCKVIPIKDAIELLIDIPTAAADRELLDARLFSLRYLVDENLEQNCEIVFMSGLNPRKRSIDNESETDIDAMKIENLMQGRNPNYVGDEKIVSDDLITIQIHCVRPHIKGTYFPDVFAAAINWTPNRHTGVLWEIAGQRKI
jgi:hypothetical protein